MSHETMKKLKLPTIGNLPERHDWLSMDEYIKFVNFNLRYFRRTKNAKQGEIAMRVNVPFLIK